MRLACRRCRESRLSFDSRWSSPVLPCQPTCGGLRSSPLRAIPECRGRGQRRGGSQLARCRRIRRQPYAPSRSPPWSPALSPPDHRATRQLSRRQRPIAARWGTNPDRIVGLERRQPEVRRRFEGEGSRPRGSGSEGYCIKTAVVEGDRGSLWSPEAGGRHALRRLRSLPSPRLPVVRSRRDPRGDPASGVATRFRRNRRPDFVSRGFYISRARRPGILALDGPQSAQRLVR